MGKKTGDEFVDDGRTIADMSAEWMPWNRGFRARRAEKRKKSKQEKAEEKKVYRAAIAGMYRAILPALICIIAAFGIVYLLMLLWLN